MISNRDVQIVNGKERFEEVADRRAQTRFRIAKCDIPDENDHQNKSVTYDILEDQFESNYLSVIEALTDTNLASQLKGTNKMFFDLFNQMLNANSEKNDVLVFIHGFDNSLTSNLEHIWDLNDIYFKGKEPLKHLVYISWPSYDRLATGYHADSENAQATGVALAAVYHKLLLFFIELFKKHNLHQCGGKIHLAAHSMGHQVLKSMLSNISGKLYPFFGEVLLFHADVEDDVFEPGQPYSKLQQMAERTHVYIHRGDAALLISKAIMNKNKRLGRKGPVNHESLNDETFVVDVTRLRNGEAPRERIVDHWGYLYSKKMIRDVIQVLNGKDEDDSREKVHRKKNWYYLED